MEWSTYDNGRIESYTKQTILQSYNSNDIQHNPYSGDHRNDIYRNTGARPKTYLHNNIYYGEHNGSNARYNYRYNNDTRDHRCQDYNQQPEEPTRTSDNLRRENCNGYNKDNNKDHGQQHMHMEYRDLSPSTHVFYTCDI